MRKIAIVNWLWSRMFWRNWLGEVRHERYIKTGTYLPGENSKWRRFQHHV